MNGRASQLRFARSSYAVAWRDFIQAAMADSCLLCCFFEGEDLKYYGIRIDLLVQGARYRSFAVGGRSGVLQILELVLTADSGRYASHPAAFFVDSDYEPPQSSHKWLYVTPDYSIENFYVRPGAFDRILRSEFGIGPGDKNHGAAIQAYQASLASFNAASRLLNAWLKQQRSIESQMLVAGHPIKSLNLTDVKIWEFVTAAFPSCAARYTIQSLDQRFSRATSVADESAIQAWAGNVTSNDPQSTHRGKFFMQFLCLFLARLVEDANSAVPSLLLEHKKVGLMVQPSNALSQFSQYADTPDSLRDFLTRLRQSLVAQGCI